jgi:hypothetical protein
MPRPAAAAVCFMTGWKHNHGRVRLISPRDMQRVLTRAGFGDVVTGALDGSELHTGRNIRGHRFYGAAGRKPA